MCLFLLVNVTEIGSRKAVATEEPMPTESEDVVRYEVSRLSLAQVCTAVLLISQGGIERQLHLQSDWLARHGSVKD